MQGQTLDAEISERPHFVHLKHLARHVPHDFVVIRRAGFADFNQDSGTVFLVTPVGRTVERKLQPSIRQFTTFARSAADNIHISLRDFARGSFCFAFGARAWLIVRLAGLVGYPSGQRGQTVNLLAHAFDGSNPSPTTSLFYKGKVVFI